MIQKTFFHDVVPVSMLLKAFYWSRSLFLKSKFLKHNLNSKLTRSSSEIHLEREGRERIRRISNAVAGVAWRSTLLDMLWISGPVTFIGATVGYYLGYGHLPTIGTLIYFFFFGVITSLASVLANIFNNYRHAGQSRSNERNLSQVIDDIPELIMQTRNLSIAQLEGDAKRREAATALLRKNDLSPDSVKLTVKELMGDDESAEVLGDIENYRRIGLRTRIHDLVDEYSPHIDPQIDALKEVAPEASQLLRERFHGHVRNLDAGVPRNEDFIERIMAAIEQEDHLLMTLDDVQQMLTLLFELINGREIPLLVFQYIGRWRLAQAFDHLEASRARYRFRQATGISRLKALTVYLAEASDTLVESVPPGLKTEDMLARSREAMNDLAQRIETRCRERHPDRAALRADHDKLANAIRLFRSMRDSFDLVERQHASLVRAQERWERISKETSEKTPQLRWGPGRRGLRISENTISLDNQAKVNVCAQLAPVIRKLYAYPSAESLMRDEVPHKRLILDVESAKNLAIEVAVVLDPYVHLSRPEVQRAINSSNAADFSAVEPGFSAATKAALGAAMSKEMVDDMSRSAHSLAVALVKHYQITLEPEAIDFLCDQYGADRQALEILGSNTSRAVARSLNAPSHTLPPIGSTPRPWYRALVQAKQVLEHKNRHHKHGDGHKHHTSSKKQPTHHNDQNISR